MNEIRKNKVLIVDDDNSNILALTQILSPEFSVYAAKNGQSAIKAAEKFLPDIILLDIVMPEMDGYAVTATLKNSEKNNDIPIIFITGLSSNEDEEKGLALGVADYITKPFSPAIVKLRIKNQVKLLEQFRSKEYDIMKYKLANDALNIALWDMDVVIDDPFNTDNKFTWSQEFRCMLGFSDENDFPNTLESFTVQIHTEDRERVLAAFADHFNDHTGKTPYDVECRISLKNGEYRYFHALGTTLRDINGVPIRVGGALRDITENKQMEEKIRYRDEMMSAVNQTAVILLNADIDSFENALYQSMEIVAVTINVDRVNIWKNNTIGGKLYCTQIYEWSGGAQLQQGNGFTVNILYEKAVPGWETILSEGNCINGLAREMPPENQIYLSSQGILSILVVPVFIKDQFWGFVGFDDCSRERVFSEEEETILRSGGLLFTDALLRNEMVVNIRDNSIRLRAAAEKALEDEERMQLMLDAMPFACGLVNPDHIFIYMNQASTTLFNISDKDDPTGKYLEMLPEFQPCGRRSLDLFHENIEKAFTEGYLRYEWLYCKPDGELIPCEETLIRAKYRGEYILAGYVRDLREQKAIIEEIRKAEIAEESNKAKSQFLATMSHEMRTPMNVVVGLTELMLDEENPAVNLQDNLKKISAAGNTLLGLINDLLDISKIEAGKLELMPVQYELPDLLNDVITLNMIRFEDKSIKFILDINESLPYSLLGDDLRVKQIFNNVLGNAFKYTQKGTVTLSVSCFPDHSLSDQESEGESAWLSIHVSDTGIGIRNEDLSKLFTVYGQVDTRSNRMIEGTGLGLAITKRLVEMMDGEINVESEYGTGSTFRLRIRQVFVDEKTIGKETAEKLCNFCYSKDKHTGKKFERVNLSYAKVLVVDDMQTNLDVAAALLGKYKMKVDCVLNGQDAVERIRGRDPIYNAIFMDHMMPGMDGIETANAIRNIGTEYAETIPVIALTANAVQGAEEMFYAHDFQAFLSKPINIMQLDSVIRKWIPPLRSESPELKG